MLGLSVAAGYAFCGGPDAWAWELVAAALHFVPCALLFIGTALRAVWWGGSGLVPGPKLVVALRIALRQRVAVPAAPQAALVAPPG